jgi:hypothetical protein
MNVSARLEADFMAPGEGEIALASEALQFVGDFGWTVASGDLLDFESLTLAPSGLYGARVVATLVNPGVRSFGSIPCMLPEEGEWNAYLVSGRCRLRIRPTTGRARVYSVALVDGHLEISRRGQRTLLFRAPAISGEVPIIATEEPDALAELQSA